MIVYDIIVSLNCRHEVAVPSLDLLFTDIRPIDLAKTDETGFV